MTSNHHAAQYARYTAPVQPPPDPRQESLRLPSLKDLNFSYRSPQNQAQPLSAFAPQSAEPPTPATQDHIPRTNQSWGRSNASSSVQSLPASHSQHPQQHQHQHQQSQHQHQHQHQHQQQQQHTPPLSAGHELSAPKVDYVSRHGNGGYAHPGMPLSAQGASVPASVNIAQPSRDDITRSPGITKRTRPPSVSMSAPRDVRNSHTAYAASYTSYPPPQPPPASPYHQVPSGIPATPPTHPAASQEQLHHHPVAVPSHPPYSGYQNTYIQTRPPTIIQNHPQHPQQSQQPQHPQHPQHLQHPQQPTHPVHHHQAPPISNNPYPSPGPPPPPSAPPPLGPWAQAQQQVQHQHQHQQLPPPQVPQPLPPPPPSQQPLPPPPPQQQPAQHPQHAQDIQHSSHIPTQHQPAVQTPSSHLQVTPSGHHHHHQQTQPPPPHPPPQHHVQAHQPQPSINQSQQQLPFTRTTTLVPTTVETRGSYTSSEPAQQVPPARTGTMGEILKQCSILCNFASRYAQTNIQQILPTAAELEEMTQRAVAVIRLLEEFRRTNLPETERAEMIADVANPSPEDIRPPKRPWEDTQDGGVVPESATFPEQNPSSPTGDKTTAEQDMEIIRTKRATSTAGGNGSAGQPKSKYRKRSRATPPGKCHSCNIRETPEWRRGPDGARTLCNACGLHYAKLMRKRDKTNTNGEQPRIDMETLRASAKAAETLRASTKAADLADRIRTNSSNSRTRKSLEPSSPMETAKPPPPQQVHQSSFQLVPMYEPDPSEQVIPSEPRNIPPPPPPTHHHALQSSSGSMPPPPPWATGSSSTTVRGYPPEHLPHQSFMRSSQHATSTQSSSR